MYTGNTNSDINESFNIVEEEASLLKSADKSHINETATLAYSEAGYQIHYQTSPKIHTFRILNANDASIHCRTEQERVTIQKPILMCFICKLSFGTTKLFALHANKEHGIDLIEFDKRLLLQRKYASAIIQKNMEEIPEISFLEPDSVQAQNFFTKTTKTLESKLSAIKPANRTKDENISINAIKQTDSTDACSSVSSSTSCSAISPKPKCGTFTNFTSITNIMDRGNCAARSENPIFQVETPKFTIPDTIPSPLFCPLPVGNIENNIDELSSLAVRASSGETTSDMLHIECKKNTDISSGKVAVKCSENNANSQGNEELEKQIVEKKDGSSQWSQTISHPVSHAVQLSSLHASWFVLSGEQNSGNVNIINDFLQQQLTSLQYQSKFTLPLSNTQLSQVSTACPVHNNYIDDDCRHCELAKYKENPHFTPCKSPIAVMSGTAPLNIQNPVSISSKNPHNVSTIRQNINHTLTTPLTTSFTIGACSDHLSGRPLDVECIR